MFPRKYSLLFLSLLLPRLFFSQKNKIDSLTAVLKTSTLDSSKVKILNQISRQYIIIANYDLSIQYAEKAKLLSEQLNSSSDQTLSNSGKKGLVNALTNIGISCRYQGNYTKALENYLKSLEISDELKDKKGIAAAYNSIGIIYANLGNYDKALEEYLKSIKLVEETGDKLALTSTYNNIGNIYRFQNNNPKALEVYLRSLKISEEINDKKGIANACNNIGDIYFDQGNYNKSLEAHLMSLKINEQTKDLQGVSYDYISIGKDKEKLGKLKEAEDHFNRSLVLGKQFGDKFLMKELYSLLSMLYEKKQDHKQAYNFQKLFSAMADTLNNERSNRLITEMNAKYEAEKKDKDLIKKDAEIQQQLALSEKKSLQLIAVAIGSVLALVLITFIFRNYRQKQKADLDKIEKEKIRAELNLLKNQISPHVMFNSLNTVYFQIDEDTAGAKEMILKFADLLRYQLYECDVEFIEIEKEINYLNKFVEMQHLRKSGRCKITFTISEDVKNFVIAPLLLIPLVENAFKYVTNDKTGENYVRISLTKIKNEVCFNIENTMYEESTNKEKNAASGIGLSNLKSRLNLIYPKQHELQINKDGAIFKVNVKINV